MNFKDWLEAYVPPNPLDTAKATAGRSWAPAHDWKIYYREKPEEIPEARKYIRLKLSQARNLGQKTQIQQADRALRDIELEQGLI